MSEVFRPGDRVKVEGSVVQVGDLIVTIEITKEGVKTGDQLHISSRKLTLVERFLPPEPAYKNAIVAVASVGEAREEIWRRARNQWDNPEGPTYTPWMNLTGSVIAAWSWRDICEYARSRSGTIKHLVPEKIFPVEVEV